MLFNSLQFLIFFPIVAAMYYIVPQKLKNYWLLIASYYFYMCWNAKYALLLLFSTVATWLSGLILQKIKDGELEDRKKEICKKLVVAVCFGVNLAILFFFKYFNFALDILEQGLQLVHIQLNRPVFDIVLPVGISFYTFQALGYTMDVYRGDIYAEKNFFQYALFVSFFPQLVAGPIERSKNLLKQLAVNRKATYEEMREGLLLMIWGFFLKIVLADRVAIFVDTVYGNYAKFPGFYLIVATILFAFQIYCDFYGYSTIAVGASKIIGIQLMENFNAPYLSTSVATFWRNWHISLTSWFKDYLYIPLGGSRKGKLRKQLNKMIVFLVSGLWHGASLSFVVWGGLNGLYQVIGEVFKPVRDKLVKLLNLNRESIGHKILCILTTFTLVDFSWIFFRANRLTDSLEIIRSMVSTYNPWILFDGSLYQCGLSRKNFTVMLLSIAILLFADIMKHRGVQLRKVIAAQDYWCRYLIMIASICAILIFGIWGSGYDAAGFIYFQF